MSTLVTSANVLDTQALQFEEPVRYEINGGEKQYYMQDIKYNGQDLYLQSDWFLSKGPRKNIFNNAKTEILVTVDKNLKEVMKALENVAKTKVIYPAEYQIDSNQKDKYFKCLPEDKKCIFGKIGQGIQCYDKNCKAMNFDKLDYGNYRVIFMVKGIYIGTHGPSDHLASLHMKVMQIQYSALNLPCMFSLIPTVHSSIDVRPISTAVPPQQGKKKARRPRLQRPKAAVEPAANMEHVDEIFESFGY